MEWMEAPCAHMDESIREAATSRQSQLTKPAGSLGRLEKVAIQLAALQQREKPAVDRISIVVFAADHGVAEEGVSAFPQEVTAQMVMNFLQGGAAISVMARLLKADLDVIDVGILSPLPEQEGLLLARAGSGTANSSKQAAMTVEQLNIALQAGCDAVDRAVDKKAELFIGGEMGIGNTTSASALYCALLDLTPEQATGAGTGLDDDGIKHKTEIIERILRLHRASIDQEKTALEWLRCVGGFEIVALTGAYLRAAQQGLPVLIDGFISSVAALCAVRLQPEAINWMFFSHLSAEQGHRVALESLGQQPLLNLGMRLGEGSGAAVAVSLMQSACALHNSMATFAEAAVATES